MTAKDRQSLKDLRKALKELTIACVSATFAVDRVLQNEEQENKGK